MYRANREPYYRHLLTLYSEYIPKLIIGRYNGYTVYIDTDTRMIYNSSGQAVMKFRH